MLLHSRLIVRVQDFTVGGPVAEDAELDAGAAQGPFPNRGYLIAIEGAKINSGEARGAL